MLLIGESLNVISKKIGRAFKERDPKPIQEEALFQKEKGMDYIEINLGPVKKDGHELMPWVVQVVQEVVPDVPLALDTSNIDAIAAASAPPHAPERTLVLGWNWKAPTIVRQLDNYVPSDSTVTVVSAYPVEREVRTDLQGLRHIRIEFREGDTTDRRLLDSLNLPTYSNVIVVSYSDRLDVQSADARTLVTLLHIREIGEKVGKSFAIVSEMLDVRNREIAESTHADDFVISNQIVSLVMTQISETKRLAPVFQDLLDPEGSELYTRPVSAYVKTGVPVTFATLVEAAAARNEVALGYRRAAQSADREASYGVHVNPKKSEVVTFMPADKVIVLAEE